MRRQAGVLSPPRPGWAADDQAVLEGIAFTDLVPRPTPSGEDVQTWEIVAGAKRLRCDMLKHRPRLIIAVFKPPVVALLGPEHGAPGLQMQRSTGPRSSNSLTSAPRRASPNRTFTTSHESGETWWSRPLNLILTADPRSPSTQGMSWPFGKTGVLPRSGVVQPWWPSGIRPQACSSVCGWVWAPGRVVVCLPG